jgi:hypothetical protein
MYQKCGSHDILAAEGGATWSRLQIFVRKPSDAGEDTINLISTTAQVTGMPKEIPLPEQCVICLRVMQACNAHALPCEHLFHGDCLTSWAERRYRTGQAPFCPLCGVEFEI